jgi:ECF transporter S component (folate family)
MKETFKNYLSFKFNVRTLVTVGMLIAAFVVLDYFSLKIGDGIKFNFGFFAVALCGTLFGPIWTMLLGIAGDLIGCIVSGNPPLWQLTVTAGLQGLIYGLLLFKTSGKRLIIGAVTARLLDTAVISLWLNTQILISVGYVSNSTAGYISRLVKAGIELPLYLAILIFILPRVTEIYSRVVLHEKRDTPSVPETEIV